MTDTPLDAHAIAAIDRAAREAALDADPGRTASTIAPHIAGGPHSPLDALITRALRRYGDFSPDTSDGQVSLMFLDLANQVLEDIRAHPYWSAPEIDYYTSIHEVRPVPDAIMVAGLLSYYAQQQASRPKLETYQPAYTRLLNQILYSRRYGNGPLSITPMDK